MARFEFIDEAPSEQKSSNRFSFVDENPSVAKDVLQQAGAKGLAGATGSYGNLLEALGMQLKSGEMLPGQKARTNLSYRLLERLNNGEALSPHELDFLVEEDVLPFFSRLPTSKDVSQQIEQTTGIGEGKTPLGRITGRSAEFLGETAALGAGGKALKTAAAAGAAGQSVRESGAPEALATGTELIASLAPGGISKNLAPASKSAQKIIRSGKQLGLTDAQITPLIQGEKKAATLSKVAKKGEKTRNLFGSIKEKLGDTYSSLKEMPEAKKILSLDERSSLGKNLTKIEAELSKTLSPSPDKKAALDYIEKAIQTLHTHDVSPEYLMNFWQDINKSINWNRIQGGKKSLASLKAPISEALKKTSPQIAETFEQTNELYSKYAQIAKKLKPDIVDSFLNKGEVVALAPAAFSLMHGNPGLLIGLAGEKAIRILSREMLINPYFQNIGNKLVNNFNEASLMQVRRSLDDVRTYLDKKHPEEDWSFINND
jgi:predicted  nucleic acid-binding Zn-ribbon protein